MNLINQKLRDFFSGNSSQFQGKKNGVNLLQQHTTELMNELTPHEITAHELLKNPMKQRSTR